MLRIFVDEFGIRNVRLSFGTALTAFYGLSIVFAFLHLRKSESDGKYVFRRIDELPGIFRVRLNFCQPDRNDQSHTADRLSALSR
jgi:hypothetical protein